MDRFSRFKGRDLNSHAPQIETYRQMYSVFPPIRKTLIQKRLTSEQIIEILNAGINQVGNEAYHP